MALLEATISDGGFIEIVNTDRDELDLCPGMTGFEEAGFFGECVFEVGVVSQGDSQGTHEASGVVQRDSRGFVLERSMMEFDLDVAAEAV